MRIMVFWTYTERVICFYKVLSFKCLLYTTDSKKIDTFYSKDTLKSNSKDL